MSLLDRHCPPDLVIFDVDGTLHDTFAWWAPVIRVGVQRFAEQEGIEIELPDRQAAEAVVGMKDAGVWAPFLPEGYQDRWFDLRSVVLPMEVEEVSRGVDYLFAGVRPLLIHLREIGVKVALASNCRSEYLAAMQDGQGLRQLTDWQFCLDSENVESKTDMLREAQQAASAQRVVMVGDREPDHEAAVAHGWPFVWRRNDRCTIDEADWVWDGDPDAFLTRLGLSPLDS
ncbi:MAG: HAD family hydrolase [Planctomycetota bacterium]